MVKASTLFSVWAILLAIQVYRSRKALNIVLFPPELPAQFSGAGECKVIRNDTAPVPLKFCEDAVLWHVGNERRLIASCDPGRKNWNTVMGPLRDPNPRGALWVYTPGSELTIEPLVIKGYPPRAYFHPLGIDVITAPGSNTSDLFVINHGGRQTTIEQFSLSHPRDPSQPPLATFVRTISSLFFRSPNSIALTSPTSFYITHDHFFTRRLPFPMGNIMPIIETMLALPLGWINHVQILPNEKIKVSWPAFGISFPNGIAISDDGKEVAVASSSSLRVLLYARDPTTNKLTYNHSIEVPFPPDNVAYTAGDEGSFTVAGHPDFPALKQVASGKADSKAPSWAVNVSPANRKSPLLGARVDLGDGTTVPETHIMKTLYQSDGSGFQSSTSAIIDIQSGTTYITGLYEEGILVCSANPR